MELSTAALDGDEATTRLALARLLERPVPRSDRGLQRQLKVLHNVFLKLRSMALIDELTGLCNRRGFMRAGYRLLDAQRRDRRGALLFYFDVDNLKVANDSTGHASGDALLLRTAQVLRSTFGRRDILSRLGGDEFAVLAATSDPMSGEGFLSRLREAIKADNAGSAPPHLSLSVGVARFDPDAPLSLAELMQEADMSMYGDKMAKLLESRHPFATRSMTHRQFR